jgi:hypothetical protein
MRTGLRLTHGADVPIFSTGIHQTTLADVDCSNPMLGELDYGDASAVGRAREAIMRMGVWVSVVDWAFQEKCQEDGLEAIVNAVLCEKAAVWQRENPSPEPIAGLHPQDVLAAQVGLFSLLSPLGVKAFAADHEMVADGIRFRPDTGNPEVGRLLSMVVPEGVATHFWS